MTIGLLKVIADGPEDLKDALETNFTSLQNNRRERMSKAAAPWPVTPLLY